jgi:hypothetical protein
MPVFSFKHWTLKLVIALLGVMLGWPIKVQPGYYQRILNADKR